MTIKNGAIMSQREKFELINSEVRSFYEYCKEAGISDEEMDIICRPLTNAVRKASFKWWTRVFLFLIMVMAIGFTVSQTDTFQWHVSAVARTLLIKVLPIWDWTPLYHNKCLIEKSRPPNLDENIVSPADCIVCEAISEYLPYTHHVIYLNNRMLFTYYCCNFMMITLEPMTICFSDDKSLFLFEVSGHFTYLQAVYSMFTGHHLFCARGVGKSFVLLFLSIYFLFSFINLYTVCMGSLSTLIICIH